MRLHLTLLMVLSAGLLTSHGQEPAQSTSREEVVVGGRTLKLPAPVGFERVDGLNAATDHMLQEMLPATNRYLARFGPPKGATPEKGRSFNVQVLRSLENREIGDRTFGDIKQQTKAEIDKSQETIRREIAKVGGKADKAFKDATDADAALSLSDVAVLGCFDESPSSLGFTMAMNIDAKAGSQTTKAKMVVAGMIVPVNGRLIYLYANADYHSAEDRTWAEQAITAWRDVVVAANPRVEGPAAGLSIFNGISRSALTGAIVGALATVIVMLFKKKKKKA